MRRPLLLAFMSASLTATAGVPCRAQEGAAPRHDVRVENQRGWDRVAARYDYAMDGAPYRFDLAEDAISGADAAFDFDVGRNVVLGVAAAGDFSQIEACEQGLRVDPGCAEAEFDSEVMARAGVQVVDSLLVYGKVGYASGRIGPHYLDLEKIMPSFTSGPIRGGLRMGAAMELSVARNVYAKAEYRHTNYGSLDDRAVDGSDARNSVNRDQATVGIGLRF